MGSLRRIRLVLARGSLGPLRAGSCDRFAARPSVSANLIAYGDRRIALVRSASPARLPSASLRRISLQSRDCLRVRVLHSCTAIFAPSALFPGISRRCTGRCVRLRLRSPRYRRIRFNRECHPSWHLRRLASRRYASHRNPTASAQAVCHPLSGGSVACLVSACASLHAGDRALCAVIAFQCSAVQQIAVQCLQFVLYCALKSRFLCARQGLKGKCCSQSVQAQRLAPILAKVRIDN